jgi:Ca2+-dependent lipid-binding protein
MRTAVCQNGGKTPRWGETFRLANSGDQNLRVEVWDYDTIGNDDLIGAGAVNIPNAIGQGGGNSSKYWGIQFGSIFFTWPGLQGECVFLLR